MGEVIMKKIVQIAVAVSFGVLGLTASVSAQQQCYIVGQTGPNSNNQCVNTENLNCQVLNNNIITIDNKNVQASTTGDGDNSNNTSTEYTVTGDATNTNSSAVSGTIVNGSCVPAVQPVTPGQGAGTVETPVAPVASSAAVTKLPNTSSNSPFTAVAAVLGTLGITALVSRIGVTAFSKFKN